MNARIVLALAAVASGVGLSGSSLALANGGVDWSAVSTYVGSYHAVTIQDGGRRSEVRGRATLTFTRSYPVHPGELAFVFDGTSVANVRNSGPAPTDACAAMGEPPNLSGRSPNAGITLTVDTAHKFYDFDAQPIKLSFEEGGYTPECGSPDGPRHTTFSEYGSVSVEKVPLPTTTEVLCGKTVFTDPGDFTAYVDWIFYPKNAPPGKRSPACPTIQKPTGGTQ